MADGLINLRSLLEKIVVADLLREMFGFAAHRLIERQVSAPTQLAYGENSALRLDQKT